MSLNQSIKDLLKKRIEKDEVKTSSEWLKLGMFGEEYYDEDYCEDEDEYEDEDEEY